MSKQKANSLPWEPGNMIRFDGVCKSFGRKTPFADHSKMILKGVDFALNKGEIICLLGPSGCGKTTMVNLIIGKMLPSAGTVQVMGERAPYAATRPRMGYMPQEDALYIDITAIENLYFFGRMNGMKAGAVREKAAELLEFGRLTDDAKKMVVDFSGGMKKRLSLCNAMMHDPDLLILDEPTVGLDPGHRRRIWNEFEEMASRGKTILVTTHVMDEAMRCSQVALLFDGRIIEKGSPQEILERTGCDDLESAFIKLGAEFDAVPAAGEGGEGNE